MRHAAYRARPEDVGALKVRASTGEMVPLSALLKVQPTVGPERAMRYNGFLTADINGGPAPGYSSGQATWTVEGIQFGDAPVGHKQFEGDERTPEGRYTIHTRNPQSAYYLSLRIDYPNARDRAFAAAKGRSPGGDIFIHGQPNAAPSGMRIAGDWTDGCIAVSNAEMDLLWSAIPDGTPIDIRP